MASKDAVLETLREVVAPLVEIDGGELYLVTVDGEDVKVHLAGACAGCPGATLTTRGVVEPALRAGNPHVRVTVSAGVTVPPGATRIEPHRRALRVARRQPRDQRAGASGSRQQRTPVE